MRVDEFGSCVYQDGDLFDLIYKDMLDFDDITVDPSIEMSYFMQNTGIQLREYHAPDMSVVEFDKKNQDNWLIPSEYLKFDIYQYCVNVSENDQQLIRCLEELCIYEKLGFIPILSVLKYIVDVLRENKIIWGVGRGSSVSSYVLYKLGVHRVDSLKYNLDYTEFLRLGE
jgi:DNA polymerase III alpha subunit